MISSLGGLCLFFRLFVYFHTFMLRDTRDVRYSIMNIDSHSFFVPSRHLSLVLFVLFLYRTSKVYPLSTGCLLMSVEQQELSHSCQVWRGSCVEIHLVCISFCMLTRSEQSACNIHVEALCAALRIISQNG